METQKWPTEAQIQDYRLYRKLFWSAIMRLAMEGHYVPLTQRDRYFGTEQITEVVLTSPTKPQDEKLTIQEVVREKNITNPLEVIITGEATTQMTGGQLSLPIVAFKDWPDKLFVDKTAEAVRCGVLTYNPLVMKALIQAVQSWPVQNPTATQTQGV